MLEVGDFLAGTVEAHVRQVMLKLSVPESGEGHRRLLAHLSAAQIQY